MEHTLVVPVWTVLVGFILWAVTNIMIWYATGRRATSILAGAKVESQAQKDEVVDHFDEKFSDLGGGKLEAEIAAIEEHIQGLDNALGAKFEEWDEALGAIPARVAQALGSMKGVETKALYKAAVEGEEELETYMAENLSATEIAMAKVEAIEPNEDWKASHPLGAMLVEGGKEWMRAKMDEARDVVTMTPGGKRRGGKPRGFK